jgi:hypothetical protein
LEWTVPEYCPVYLYALKYLLTGKLNGSEIIGTKEIKLLQM